MLLTHRKNVSYRKSKNHISQYIGKIIYDNTEK